MTITWGDCCTTVICEVVLQIAFSFGFRAQSLDGRHHFRLLIVICLTQR